MPWPRSASPYAASSATAPDRSSRTTPAKPISAAFRRRVGAARSSRHRSGRAGPPRPPVRRPQRAWCRLPGWEGCEKIRIHVRINLADLASTADCGWKGFAEPLRSRPERCSTTPVGSTLIRALEELVCVATAAQAALAVELDESQRANQAPRCAGRPAGPRRRGAGGARAAESHHRGQRHLGLAKIVAAELPRTWAAWRAGRITEWKATLIARETACLTREDRAAVDAAVAATPTGSSGWATASWRGLPAGGLPARPESLRDQAAPGGGRPRRHPAAGARRDDLAHRLLPVKHGVAVLRRPHADGRLRPGRGRPRTKGQVMADTLVDSVLAAATTATMPRPVGSPPHRTAGHPPGRRLAGPGDDRRRPLRHQ